METLLTGLLIFWFIAMGLFVYNEWRFRKFIDELLGNENELNKKMKSDIKELRSMIKFYKKVMK